MAHEGVTIDEWLTQWNNADATIAVHTSGSTGTPKTILVEKKRMLASAKMTCDFLQLKAGDTALLCMSLQHIGAMMMVVRSIERNLQLVVIEACGHPMSRITEVPQFIAMVPLQVYNTLSVPEEKEKLQQCQHLIIGGGSIDEQLQKELRTFPNAVWSTYGMTETLSHIALRRINGPEADEWYHPFEGVQIRLNEEDCLCIKAPLLLDHELQTNDRAIINEKGYFKIIGRKDNVVNSGGFKIQLEEVEQQLKHYGWKEFALGSYPDPKFGEQLVLLYTQEKSDAQADIAQLPKYWQPKRILHTESIPYTSNGKIARQEVQKRIKQLIEA